MQADQHPIAQVVPAPMEVTVLPGKATAATRSSSRDRQPARPRPSKGAMRLGLVAVAIALLALAAVVAIPRFMTKQPAVASRTISLPPTLAGEEFMPSGDPVQQTRTELADMAADFAATGIFIEDPQQASYENSRTSADFGVIASKLRKRPSAAAQNAFLAGESTGYSVAFSSVVPGPYGGQMECLAASPANEARCVSIDDVAVITVQAIGPKTVDEVASLTRQIISGVEH